jgi:hypothetical protein
MDKVLETIINDLAKEYDVEPKEIEKVLIAPYKMMKEKIQALELKGKLYEECEGMKTNFNIPGMCKIYLNEYKINDLNKRKDDERSGVTE